MPDSITQVLAELAALNQRLDGIERRLDHIQSQMGGRERASGGAAFTAAGDVTAIQRELDKAHEAVAELTKEKEDLQGKIRSAQEKRPTIKVDELVKRFGAALATVNGPSAEMPTDRLQRSASGSPTAPASQPQPPPVVVASMEVEMKGGVTFDEQGELRLASFRNHELSPGNASTVRFTLNPVTRINVVE